MPHARPRSVPIAAAAGALLALAAAACTTRTEEPRTVSEGAGEVQATTAALEAAPGSAAAALHLVVAPAGNAARYKVRERLMGRDLDNDAVGVTSEVSGGIALDSAGAVIPALSRFTVRTSGFTSDAARRDGYVRGRLLESEAHPVVTFAPTSVRGLAKGAATAPAGATHSFQLVGDLTVKGVTRPARWQVTARRAGATVTGSASTAFTFAEFGLTQPRVPVVLSVADTIRLEYDFTLAPAAPATSAR